jgi:hypothetical protein
MTESKWWLRVYILGCRVIGYWLHGIRHLFFPFQKLIQRRLIWKTHTFGTYRCPAHWRSDAIPQVGLDASALSHRISKPPGNLTNAVFRLQCFKENFFVSSSDFLTHYDVLLNKAKGNDHFSTVKSMLCFAYTVCSRKFILGVKKVMLSTGRPYYHWGPNHQ